jgi:hypothetical protein
MTPWWAPACPTRPAPRIYRGTDGLRVIWLCDRCNGPKSHDCADQEQAQAVLAMVRLTPTCSDCATPTEGKPEPGQQMEIG